jgi:anhydro-N-acetylmuramic acid kinase
MRGQGDKAAIAHAITQRHREAVEALIQQSGLARAEIKLIGFHGQTIRHMPHEGITEQIGDAAWLAAQTGIAVVADFRSNDVKHGGQGAPLVPLYHAALAHALPRPVMVVNIGGVANVTWIGEKEESRVESRESSNLPLPSRGRVREGGGEESAELAAPPSTFAKASVDKPNLPRKGGGISVIAATFPLDSRRLTLDSSLLAFDCGPGNALIDDWMRRHTGAAHDENGVAAARGRVDKARVATFLGDEFFARPAPKSLDRHHFSLDLVAGLSLADGAATLTAMTASAIAASVQHVPAPPRQWLITGGGRHNATLMRMVQEEVAGSEVRSRKLEAGSDVVDGKEPVVEENFPPPNLPPPAGGGVTVPVVGGVATTSDNSQSQSQSQSETQSRSELKSKSGAEAESEFGSKSGAEAESEFGSKSGAKSEFGSKSGAEAEIMAQHPSPRKRGEVGWGEEVARKVIPVESVGWNGDALEAEAFAYLAARSVKNLPLTLASTTGVSQPVTGGVFYPV